VTFGSVDRRSIQLSYGRPACKGSARRAVRSGRLREQLAADRARIAAELNDAVAHGVADVLMQANAAAEILERDPDAAAAALRAVQERGRATLGELRRMLFVMRAANPDSPI
jgi:signal transduction histidine kinase